MTTDPTTIRWYLWEADDGSSSYYSPSPGHPDRHLKEEDRDPYTLAKTFDVVGCGKECWDENNPPETPHNDMCRTCYCTGMQALYDHYDWEAYNPPLPGTFKDDDV